MKEGEQVRLKIEKLVSISYVFIFVLLLEGISWLFGDMINAHFGRKAGAFALYVLFPLSLVLGAIITFVGAYFFIMRTYGKEMAERVLFRWRH